MRLPLHQEIRERGGDAIHLNWASRVFSVYQDLLAAMELMDIGEYGKANSLVFAALDTLGDPNYDSSLFDEP